MLGTTVSVLGGFWSGSPGQTTAIGEITDASPGAPLSFAVHPARPNPFNPATTIQYDLPAAALVRMGVYDTNGRLVTRLTDEPRPAGRHTVRWDAANQGGVPVASGVYFVVTEAGTWSSRQKITLLK